MHCTNCGTAVDSGTRFCPNCGASQGPAPTPAAYAPAMPQASAGGNGAKFAVGGIVAALVLGGVGFWGWSSHNEAQEASRKVKELERSAQAQLPQQQAVAPAGQAAQAAQASPASQTTTVAALASPASQTMVASPSEQEGIAAARAALDRAIAEEEAEARQRLGR